MFEEVSSLHSWGFSKGGGRVVVQDHLTHSILIDTVDGRNPAPPGMEKNLVNTGSNYLSTGAGFLPSTAGIYIYDHTRQQTTNMESQNTFGAMSKVKQTKTYKTSPHESRTTWIS